MPDTRQQTAADKIRAALTAQTAQIRTARDLSNEGRAHHLARTYVQARDEMTSLKRADAEKRNRRRAELQQLLFGNPRNSDSAAVISYRDAQDRADKLKDPQEAAALLERAIMSKDEFLGRAIAMRAMARLTLKGLGDGWAQVADRWVQQQDPYTAELVQELADIEQEIAGKDINGLALKAK
jgi:hypothetical protein